MNTTGTINNITAAITKEIENIKNPSKRMGNIPGPSMGNISHIPQLKSKPENGLEGTIKDSIFRETNLPFNELKVVLGYGVSARLDYFSSKGVLPILISSIEYFKDVTKNSPEDFHYGDFIKLKEIKHLENNGGYEVTFENNSVPFISIDPVKKKSMWETIKGVF